MPLDMRRRSNRDGERPRCLVHDWNCPQLDGSAVDRGLALMLCEARREEPPSRTGPCQVETPAQVRERMREFAELLEQARAELREQEAAFLAGGGA